MDVSEPLREPVVVPEPSGVLAEPWSAGKLWRLGAVRAGGDCRLGFHRRRRDDRRREDRLLGRLQSAVARAGQRARQRRLRHVSSRPILGRERRDDRPAAGAIARAARLAAAGDHCAGTGAPPGRCGRRSPGQAATCCITCWIGPRALIGSAVRLAADPSYHLPQQLFGIAAATWHSLFATLLIHGRAALPAAAFRLPRWNGSK